MTADPTQPATRILPGSPDFRRVSLALFALGFSTFSLLYTAQPLLPVFSAEFGVGAAESSLSVSLATGSLAVAMLGAGAVSDALGRRRIMVASLLASALLTLAVALAPNWTTLLVLRALCGVALSGLPAVAMAYVAEEMDSRALGLAMGLLVGGNSIGGMAGRLITGVLTDLTTWRIAVAAVGVVGLAGAAILWLGLPPSRHFRPQPLAPRALFRSFARHFADPGLPLLFAESFLLMGGFVTLYNYIGYRLAAPPFGLGHAAIAAVFLAYLTGPPASTLIGALGGRIGRRRVFPATIGLMLAGVAMTMSDDLVLVVGGIGVATFAFFAAHSVASSWVGLRAVIGKGQAASLYLFFYYAGSSLVGSASGVVWTRSGWTGIAFLVGSLLVLGIAISVRLAFVPPVAVPPVALQDAPVEDR